MPFHATLSTDFRFAFFARPSSSTREEIAINVLWLDPFAASFRGAVEPMLGRVLGIFAVP